MPKFTNILAAKKWQVLVKAYFTDELNDYKSQMDVYLFSWTKAKPLMEENCKNSNPIKPHPHSHHWS